ncbi:MAG: alpha/beta hydrolase family protein [Clostridiales bacterium]|nr:alpha/beta hydrolase family protein [Clostridiales bacterium]
MNFLDYKAESFLKNRIENDYRKDAFSGETAGDFTTWKKRVSEKIRGLLGLEAFIKKEFCPVVSSGKDFDGYIRKKCSIEGIENLRMPFYILEPKEGGNSVPVIALHGHGCEGKEGLCGDSARDERYNYSYALDFVKKGCTVFVPDLLGFGERLEEISKTRGEGSSCNHLNNALTSLGTSLQGANFAEISRFIDYIEESGYDLTHLTAVGFSGGGLGALFAAALDERVKICYVSGYYHSFKDTLLKNNLCGCNFVPGLWERVDIADFGAMVCPRRLIIEYGAADSLNFGCEKAIEETKRVYELCGRSDRLKVLKGRGGHKFYGLGIDEVYNSMKTE